MNTLILLPSFVFSCVFVSVAIFPSLLCSLSLNSYSMWFSTRSIMSDKLRYFSYFLGNSLLGTPFSTAGCTSGLKYNCHSRTSFFYHTVNSLSFFWLTLIAFGPYFPLIWSSVLFCPNRSRSRDKGRGMGTRVLSSYSNLRWICSRWYLLSWNLTLMLSWWFLLPYPFL